MGNSEEAEGVEEEEWILQHSLFWLGSCRPWVTLNLCTASLSMQMDYAECLSLQAMNSKKLLNCIVIIIIIIIIIIILV